MSEQVDIEAENKQLKEQVAWYQLQLDEHNQIFYQEGLILKIARKLTKFLTKFTA